MKATAVMTGGSFSMSETTLQAGMNGPPPHAHKQTTDTFYVLEGMLQVHVGDQKVDAPSGSYILIPPGIVHTFANTSEKLVRFLNINSPAGWENYLRDLSKVMSYALRNDSGVARVCKDRSEV